MTTAPTPLELLDAIAETARTRGLDSVSYTDLRAFLQSPAVQALADPKLRAAAEVVIGRLPELMEMEAKATPGPWWGKEEPRGSLWWAIRDNDLVDVTEASALDAAFIVAARNALHDAAQAAKEAEHE